MCLLTHQNHHFQAPGIRAGQAAGPHYQCPWLPSPSNSLQPFLKLHQTHIHTLDNTRQSSYLTQMLRFTSKFELGHQHQQGAHGCPETLHSSTALSVTGIPAAEISPLSSSQPFHTFPFISTGSWLLISHLKQPNKLKLTQKR